MFSGAAKVRMFCDYLVTFAIVFQATGSLTMTSFVMSPGFRTPSNADFRLKRVRISIKAGTNGAQTKFLMFQIIRTADAIATVAKFSVGKTIAIPARKIKFERINENRTKMIFIQF